VVERRRRLDNHGCPHIDFVIHIDGMPERTYKNEFFPEIQRLLAHYNGRTEQHWNDRSVINMRSETRFN